MLQVKLVIMFGELEHLMRFHSGCRGFHQLDHRPMGCPSLGYSIIPTVNKFNYLIQFAERQVGRGVFISMV